MALLVAITAVSGATAAQEKKVTLNIWDVQYFPKQPGSAGALGRALLASDKLFMKQNPNVIVKHVGVPGSQFITSMQTFVASRKGPDVVTNGGGSFPQVSGFSKAMVPMYNLITKQMRLDMGNQLLAEGIGDEPHYAIPVQSHVYLMYYNKAMFAKAGITSIPQTLSQLLSACTKLKDSGVDTPITNGFAGSAGQELWHYAMGSQVLSNSGLRAWSQRKIGWTDPRIAPGLQYLQTMAAQGCFGDRATAAARQATEGLSAFEGGRGAMVFWNVIDTKELGAPVGGVKGVGTFAFPRVPTSVYPAGTPDSGYNANWSIMNYSKNICIAWKYVEFSVGRVAQRLMWNIGRTLTNNGAVKVKGSNPVEKGIQALAANTYGQTGPGATTSAQESSALERQLALLISGSISPGDLVSQLQSVRDGLDPLPPQGKLPKPLVKCN
jgi:ABC-type glycerol-3-phosphate transport system substrate-binding protein